MHEIASKMHKNRYQRWWSSRRAPILPIVRWGEDTVPQTSPHRPLLRLHSRAFGTCLSACGASIVLAYQLYDRGAAPASAGTVLQT